MSSRNKKLVGKYSKGNVLVASLIFIMILTVLGVGAMQSSSLEYRMSTNTAFKKQAFENAESGRASITQVLYDHVYGAGWQGVNLAAGLTVLDKDGDSAADTIFINASSDTPEAHPVDAQYGIDNDSDGSISAGEVVSNISVFEVDDDSLDGSGLDFTGSTGAPATDYKIIRIESVATSAGGATSTIVSDYRAIY